MKQLMLGLAKYTGLFHISRFLTRKETRILAYHGIWMGEGHFGNFLYMSPEGFERKMRRLVSLRYPVIPLEQALTSNDKSKKPYCATVITIDDGWHGTYLHMLPILESLSLPATIYLCSYYSAHERPVFDVMLGYLISKAHQDEIEITGPAGNLLTLSGCSTEKGRNEAKKQLIALAKTYDSDLERQQLIDDLGKALDINLKELLDKKVFHLMSAAEVSDSASRGFSIELHTHRHRIASGERSCLPQELDENSSYIKMHTPQDPSHFCYPSGIYDQEFWPEMLRWGISSATTTETGFLREDTHNYAIPRILDGENVSLLEFEAELSGILEILRRLRCRLKSQRRI